MRAGSLHVAATSGSTGAFGVVASTTTAENAEPRPPAITLAQYAASWLEGLEGLVHPGTAQVYAGRLERHVLPRLGERRLDEIDVDDILGLISDLRKHGYSGTTIAV